MATFNEHIENGQVVVDVQSLIKTRPFSGTTDNTGNLLIGSYLEEIGVGAKFNQHGICQPFIYLNGGIYVHCADFVGNVMANTPISGEYYYIER